MNVSDSPAPLTESPFFRSELNALRPERVTRSQEIKTRVLAALVRSGYSALTWVGCDVRGDQVILQGSVPSYHLKQLAQVFAQRVDGVERIQNCLEVSRRLPA